MRKFLSILTILAVVLSFTACSETVEDSVNKGILSNKVSVEPFDFGEYDYKFKVEVDGLKLSIPSTLGEYLDAGLVNLEGDYGEEAKLEPGVMYQTVLKTPNGMQLNVSLSNPTNRKMLMKDVFVSGISMHFDKELEKDIGETKIYPLITDATQKYLFPGVSVEDAEIILGLGEHSKLLHTEYLENEDIIHQVSYGDEDINALVIGQYGMETGLLNISINFENLNTVVEDMPPEPGPAPIPVK